MSTEKPTKDPLPGVDCKDHMANERTFLAWIRTSIGIMAFGFVVEKFALFIKQIGLFLSSRGLSESDLHIDQHLENRPSLFGVLLVGMGAVIGGLSFLIYRNTAKKIEENNYRYPLVLPCIVTVLVVMMGVSLLIYLFKS
jgi:uncharacterized membrane protein YidH (DUF202 family)